MIYLTCPGCSAELELDDGFRGGVCRCSQCRTMMTVPDDPDHESAEKLERPSAPGARPSSPGGRPDAPGGRPDSPGRPDAPGGPSAPTDAGDQAEDDEFKVKIVEKGESLEEQVFVTATGKQVTLTAEDFAKVPSAPKRRMGIRVTIIAMFIVICVVLTAMLVGAFIVVLNMNSTDPDEGSRISEEVLGPQKNPFSYEEKPHVFGWEANLEDKRVLIVVDTSRSMATSKLHILNSMENTIKSLEKVKPGCKIQFAFMTKDKPTYFPASPRAPRDVNVKKLKELYSEMLPSLQMPLQTIFESAMVDQIDTIYLIGAFRGSGSVKTEFEAVTPQLKEKNIKLISIWMGQRPKTPDYIEAYERAYWEAIDPEQAKDFKPKTTSHGDFTRFETEIMTGPVNP